MKAARVSLQETFLLEKYCLQRRIKIFQKKSVKGLLHIKMFVFLQPN